MKYLVYYLDDEPMLLEIFEDALEGSKIEVRTFADPEALIEACKVTPPDSVMLDYRMPKLSGNDVALKLCPQIPKFLVSGDIKPVLTTKFEKVFEKPLQFDLVKEFLEEYSTQATSKAGSTPASVEVAATKEFVA